MPEHFQEFEDFSGLDGVSAAAQSITGTPYDYLVVGSGASGGTLAARLASYGFTVLVLEAGVDPGAPLRDPATTSVADQRRLENERRLYHCPGLNAAATEPHLYTPPPAATALPPLDPTSWSFAARHFANDKLQKEDRKFDDAMGGVLYPRGCGVGGSTGHHALITIVPADSDWQRIADLTNDSSWSPARMRAIFRRIERASYGVVTGKIARFWNWVKLKLGMENDGRGRRGWLDISIADPKEGLRDLGLRTVLLLAIFRAEGLAKPKNLWRLFMSVVTGGIYRHFDLNDPHKLRTSPQGFTLTPMCVNRANLRRGPREHLLEVRRALRRANSTTAGRPRGRVDIATGVHVRRLLFLHENEQPPRAIGVEFSHGLHLYRADPKNPAHLAPADQAMPEPAARRGQCFAKREIFLCGGTFNTPQLLMLSGIGEVNHLQKVSEGGKKEGSLTYVNPGTGEILEDRGDLPAFVDLPSVGKNLQDRCEFSVISALKRDYSFLRDLRFEPYPPEPDPQLNDWLAGQGQAARIGSYTSNGSAFALVRRTSYDAKHLQFPPDLLILGLPVAFRGYFREWSKNVLNQTWNGVQDPGNPEVHSHRLWSWTLLKAYSRNTGNVRLRSADPFAQPQIDFRYYGESPKDPYQLELPHDDLEALVKGVEYVRQINDSAGCVMDTELEPGRQRKDGSPELRDWIIKETWGHHASGTCAMGADSWRADPRKREDVHAVVDSKFRVHGVRGLRIVDASVFRYIPGYFIALPIFMIAEKAADTILDELSP